MHFTLSSASIKTTILSVFLICFGFTSSQAQDSENTIDSLIVNAPKAIPLTAIIQNIQKTNEDLKLIERKLEANKAVHRVDSLYPTYAEYIDKQQEQTQKVLTSNPNRQKIENLYTKWNGNRIYLTGIEDDVNNYVSKNTRLLETIELHHKTWDLTLENAKNEEAPKEILTRITDLIKDIETVNEAIIEENNTALKLESKINFKVELINEIMEEILTLKTSETYDLFHLRNEPLWKTSFSKTKKSSNTSVLETASDSFKELVSFIKVNKSSFYLYFALILFLFGIVYFLKRGFEKYEFVTNDPNLLISKDVILKHPVATFIFLSLLLGNIFFTGTPKLFESFLILGLIIASSYVVRPQIKTQFKNIYYVITFFYVIDSLKTFLWFHPGVYRIYLLLEATLIGVALYLLLKKLYKMSDSKVNPLSKFLIQLSPVIYILVFIAVMSNILGYTNLTDITLKICTHIGVITVIFYSLLLILEGISTSLIHRHFSSKAVIDHSRKLALEIKLMKILRVVVLIFWFLFFLNMIEVYRPLKDYLTDVLSEPYSLGTITITIGSILSFIIILASSYLLTTLISFMIDDGDGEGILKSLRLPKGIPAAVSLVIRYFIVAFGFVFALSSLGMDLSKFNLLAGAMGIGIGFGLQTLISNFVSGLILVFERPILQGDTVEVDNLLGRVHKIGVRSSKIRTFDGAEVIVPNYNLMSNNLINWTLSDNIKRIDIFIGAAYDADPNLVLEILAKAGASHPNVLKTPPARGLFLEFGDNSLNFVLQCWVHYEVSLVTKSEVSVAVYNAFKEANIEIPFPQRDIHIKSMPNNNTLEDTKS
ncbi:mechanosensitive ion channel family protein [Aestuariibaculum lutulentum]|uniref:Mechanosensitive ion channel n=2 Tax=Aestuariibaculum lutulentum TaxID=2920935 RepID=A0ABS9RF33_9FLAO|nr:mechanosensitive ion channel domain-containing protein [Aestuariibaculum lutulentum]MCH4551543.1 mechanosensitive ion channel [Aestuariibaculum lutulentum]